MKISTLDSSFFAAKEVASIYKTINFIQVLIFSFSSWCNSFDLLLKTSCFDGNTRVATCNSSNQLCICVWNFMNYRIKLTSQIVKTLFPL